MTAVLLGAASAALFGAMTVVIRLGLRTLDDARGAAAATVAVAFAVSLAAWAFNPGVRGAWPFLITGAFVPGVSQVLFTLAVKEVGASRTAVAVGAAPLVAVTIALLALDEPLRAPLAVGAVAIVAGGVLLAAERDRPEHLRPLGLIYAALCTILFATRDNVARALHTHTAAPTAAAATLLAGTLIAMAWARRPPTRTELRRMWPAGICFGLSYVCLFEAYFRGRVSVVSPLVATESLWGVVFSALFIRHTEGVGRRLLLGALLIVAGGVLIGAAR